MSISCTCDCCLKHIKRAHRTYKGKTYCQNCYKKYFKKRLCPKCGNFARLPSFDLNSVCKRCEVSKPCIRCGTTEYATGKLTIYGPVCNACAPYFREEKPCEACGRPSRRLTRVTRFKHQKLLCPSCARSDHGTCEACQRHRRLHRQDDGRMLCATCQNIGEIVCPKCGLPMPAGMGKKCKACSWEISFRKRLKIDTAAFRTRPMAHEFEVFGEWLLTQVSSQKAALSIHRYLPFFLKIEESWGNIPRYSDLLTHFGAEGLRRVQLPMRWLNTIHKIAPNPKAREADSEKQRIVAILNSTPANSPASNLLTSYYNHLNSKLKKGKTSLRSIRLALRPAASLLQLIESPEILLPDQNTVNTYLNAHPGQLASLTGFIIFLNSNFHIDLKQNIDQTKLREYRRNILQKKIITMYESFNNSNSMLNSWVITCLEYFHSVKINNKLLKTAIIEEISDGINVKLQEKVYWLPRYNQVNLEAHF